MNERGEAIDRYRKTYCPGMYEELQEAEARVRELQEAILSALATYPENEHLHSILERALVPANEETAG